MDGDVETALTELQLSRRWLDYGLCDEQRVLELHKAYRQSEDDCAEHYRAAAFHGFFDSRDRLSDDELKGFIDVCREVSDPVLLAHPLHLLAAFTGLTDEQAEYLAAHPDFQEDSLRRRSAPIMAPPAQGRWWPKALFNHSCRQPGGPWAPRGRLSGDPGLAGCTTARVSRSPPPAVPAAGGQATPRARATVAFSWPSRSEPGEPASALGV
jgi:hypothetical protein